MESALKTSKIDHRRNVRELPLPDRFSQEAFHVLWDGATLSEWEDVTDASPFAPVYQTYAYGDALEQLGRRILRARIFAHNELIGVAQIEMRKIAGFFTIAHIMRGPVWRGDTLPVEARVNAIEAIRADLPVKGAHAFVVMPEGDGDEFPKKAGYRRVMSGYHTALLDISGSEEDVRARLDGKWRNRLRAAEKSDLRLSPLGKKPEKYGWLMEKEAHRQRTLNYKSPSISLAPHYQAVMGARSVYGFEAKIDAERVGGALFLKHGRCATYHIGWTNGDGKAANANNLLLWQGIKALKRAGVEILDLDGVNTDINPGIARFKIGAGARVISLSGAWTKGPAWK